MAELFEIENVLVCTIAQVVYPNGTAASSATGTPVRIHRGWPEPEALSADLKAKFVRVSVFPLDIERNVTRYPRDWIELPQPPIFLTLTVLGNTVTIGGRITCPLNVAILVDGTAYVYPLQATDTPTSVATALSALIPNATSSGPVVTLKGGKIEARVGNVGTVIREIRRQAKSFRISVWCPTPAIRDALSAVIDPVLAEITYLNLPDGSAGRIRYVNTHTNDGGQKAQLYRRDFVYSVEYATTGELPAPAVINQRINLTGGLAPSSPITTIKI